ncbi:MAG: aminotransferase class I/II-fold pyridoxal phosphate-dependent enzyme [Planctomycetota bacterium]
MNLPVADRLQKLPPYLFAALRKAMREAKAKGIEVIRVDIGDPDTAAPDPIVQELIRAVDDKNDPDRHRYGCDRPVAELPQAVIDWYKRRYDVSLSADQVVMTMGSKDAIVKFCMGLLNPGDVGIAPLPGYPTYNIGHVFCSAVTHYVPLRAENGFLMDFDEIGHEVRQQAKILWLNYPNNPTSATADLDFFKRAVEFGRENDILICHDAAYIENVYDGYEAPSILQVDGADEVAVEFYSLSKGFSMTGWRLGFVAGNASAVGALNTVKENVDNGSLRALQSAATVALEQAEQLVKPINKVYQRRRDMVVDMLNAAGWNLDKPKATIYIWAPVPDKYNGDSGKFVADLLAQKGVMVTPGRGYGVTGEGFFRISLSYPDDVLKEAIKRIIEMV